YGWGLFFSALARSVLGAIGLAVLAQLTFWTAAALIVLLTGALVAALTGWDGVIRIAPHVATLLWVIAPLPLSALVYSRVDRARWPPGGSLVSLWASLSGSC